MKTATLANRSAPVQGSPRLRRLAAIDWERSGLALVRLGLVLAIGWIGLMKFSAYEAGAIEGLVANSPLMAWIYSFLSVRGAGVLFGTVEVSIAILIALRPISPRATALGSALAALTFLVTLSFLLSTPGVAEPSAGGFPAISVVPGQFLIKDLVLLGGAIWSFGEAWRNS